MPRIPFSQVKVDASSLIHFHSFSGPGATRFDVKKSAWKNRDELSLPVGRPATRSRVIDLGPTVVFPPFGDRTDEHIGDRLAVRRGAYVLHLSGSLTAGKR